MENLLNETGYTPDQIAELEAGREAGIDTAVFENPDFLAIQMRQLRLGREKGLDVSLYANPAFDWFQMEQIRKGIEAKIDVTSYAKPTLSHKVMRQMRLALQDGIDISAYLSYRFTVLREIRRALRAGVDIMPYVEMGYNSDQLEQIRISLEKDVQIQPFLRVVFCGAALEEIRIGVSENLDVSLYAKEEYSWRQMRELRYGLEKRVDIHQYDNPLYSHQQMREIRLGLENGLPVDSYKRMRFSATDMRKKREALMCRMQETEINLSTSFEDIEKMIAVEHAREDAFHLVISNDEMEVYLVIKDRSVPIAVDDILKKIWDEKIRKGILRREIKKAVDGTYEEDTVLVACGQSPRSGKDGWYEYFFRTDIDGKPKVLPDGSVDYQNIEWFDTVAAGQQIAVYHPAENGSDGYTVRGEVLPSIRGREQKVLTGNGFILADDQRTYFAGVDGMISIDKGCMNITSVLDVNDVTSATGNVAFSGNIRVKGNVGTGAVVRSGGDVVVDGFVEGAQIFADGDIILRNGMNGSGKGTLVAKGNITGRFLEGVDVTCGGDIDVNSCLNCNVVAEGYVRVDRKGSVLVGGTIVGAKGIIATTAGTRSGTLTVLKTGASPKLLEESKELAARSKSVSDELRILTNAKMEFVRKYSPEFLATQEVYVKIGDALYTKNKEYNEINAQITKINEQIKELSNAKVQIQGSLYEGVRIEIGGCVWKSAEMSYVTIKKTKEDGREKIVAFTN